MALWSLMPKTLIDDPKHKAAKRPRISSPSVEWCDVRTVQALFGIRESALYELLRAGAIKSILMRKPGRARGKRLISAPSLRKYLASLEAK